MDDYLRRIVPTVDTDWTIPFMNSSLANNALDREQLLLIHYDLLDFQWLVATVTRLGDLKVN